MKPVAKYNLFKGISTFLTIGSPIITLCSCSSLFIHRSETAISAAGIFTILISMLFLKDKIVENFKLPSPFIISLIVFVLIKLLESILLPMKYVCIVTMITSGIDEISFKRLYKKIEMYLSNEIKSKKFMGFIFARSDS